MSWFMSQRVIKKYVVNNCCCLSKDMSSEKEQENTKNPLNVQVVSVL